MSRGERPQDTNSKTKTIMTTTPTPTFRILADFGYYYGTLNAPKDGYLTDPYGEPREFDSVKDAVSFLTNKTDQYDAMHCVHDGDATFSVDGNYQASHGQHSRPVYTIVSRASGKCTKAIKSEVEAICA